MHRITERRSRPRGGGPVKVMLACAGALLGALLFPALVLGHLERPSYWPDPAPDTSVRPAAGGAVPEARTLTSAVKGRGRGEVRVVCQGREGRRSLKLALRSIRQARARGFRVRPSQPRIVYSRKKARRMRTLNRRLRRQCEYRSIQPAIFDSSNNDRVVIMPGRYREPRSRRRPTDDPRCADLTIQDSSGAETPSYEYQVRCPNDQNLVYVQGRALGGDPPSPPLGDRHGIPDEGRCVRCNLQIEGSGPKPTDVIIDAGERYGGKARRPGAKPADHSKHVVLRVDRADGFVGRNFLMRGGLEFGFYTEETDGVLLDRTKFFWNADYGHLSFTSDHHLVKNCDGFGSGDAVVYPGAAPETGEQATGFYPDAPRINTVIRRCDLHGSTLGYSGSMGNAVRITRNHVYGNTTGIATDTEAAGGHPGYPADSAEIDHNLIYSNNLNLYKENPPVEPTVGPPVGVGVIWVGHNNGEVHNNRFFDNWFRGTMLIAVPDAFITATGSGPEGDVYNRHRISCETAQLPSEAAVTTSCGNEYYGNKMGRVPPGFQFPKAVSKFGNPSAEGGRRLPNGLDFWWDEFPGNTGNCWRGNTGPDGTRDSLTADPPMNPVAGLSVPQFLPEKCGSSVGSGDPVKEAVLADCAMWEDGDTAEDHIACDWFDDRSQPGTPAARSAARERARAEREYRQSDDAAGLRERLDEILERSQATSAFNERP